MCEKCTKVSQLLVNTCIPLKSCYSIDTFHMNVHSIFSMTKDQKSDVNSFNSKVSQDSLLKNISLTCISENEIEYAIFLGKVLQENQLCQTRPTNRIGYDKKPFKSYCISFDWNLNKSILKDQHRPLNISKSNISLKNQIFTD